MFPITRPTDLPEPILLTAEHTRGRMVLPETVAASLAQLLAAEPFMGPVAEDTRTTSEAEGAEGQDRSYTATTFPLVLTITTLSPSVPQEPDRMEQQAQRSKELAVSSGQEFLANSRAPTLDRKFLYKV
jgi:hypothetical protein